MIIIVYDGKGKYMSDHMIFDENSLYELDEECLKQKGKEQKEEKEGGREKKRKNCLSTTCNKPSKCDFKGWLLLFLVLVCTRK